MKDAGCSEGMGNGQPCIPFATAPIQSIMDDPVCRALIAMMAGDREGRIWNAIIFCQEYPDPELLLRNESFAACIMQTEPGKHIDYEKIQKDLQILKDNIPGGRKAKEHMYEIWTGLVQARIGYILAASKVTVLELYDKMIDRFYGQIADQSFERAFSLNKVYQIQRSWPEYGQSKLEMLGKTEQRRKEREMAIHRLLNLKSSITTKVFFAKLKTALEVQQVRVQKPNVEDMTLQLQNVQAVGPTKTIRDRHSIQRALIAQHNARKHQARVLKNRDLKYGNVNNIHQFGEQSRVPLSDNVIRALSNIQTNDVANLIPDDNDDDEEECENGFTTVEMGPGMGGLVNSGQNVTAGGEDLLDGIILPDGFEHLSHLSGSSQ